LGDVTQDLEVAIGQRGARRQIASGRRHAAFVRRAGTVVPVGVASGHRGLGNRVGMT
jgi:hypothetical protein